MSAGRQGGTMLKKNALLLFALVMGAGALSAGTLTIRVENIEPGRGHLMAGIFNDEKSFPDTYYRGQRIAATDSVMVVTFSDLPEGSYAVSVYQDSNGNGQLDKNIFGIPKEKYGFSSHADRPVFKKCLFSFSHDMTITLRLN
jgi:uncharacterized protein (DUF2141 family)